MLAYKRNQAGDIMQAIEQIQLTDTILSTQKLGKEFNGVWVLKDIDFELKRGEIHALVGENGAGKSTFIKMLSGVYQPSAGCIQLNEQPITFNNVRESEDHGIRTVHQEVNLVPFFSVYQNIFIGAERKKKIAGVEVMDDTRMRKEAKEVIQGLGIDFDVNKSAMLLNASMKRIVEISKVLVHEPQVVIFDEPTTSLGEEERKKLLGIIKGLKKRGLSILYISHNLEEVMEIADRITVFRDGENIGTLEYQDATIDKIIAMMIGNADYKHYIRENNYSCEDIYLEIKNLSTEKLADINLSVCKGEIVGIAGVVGAGKTEIAKAVFGLDKIDEGCIEICGKSYKPSPLEAIRNKIALVPEERQAQGLIPNYCVSKNVTLTYLDRYCKTAGFIDRKRELETADDYIQRMGIRCTGPMQAIKFLSGGNQQKAILSRWLNGDFDIGIFDEPTKGIDVKAKEDIYSLIEELAQEGKAILVLSSYLPELLSLCDRIVVVSNGRLVGEFDPKQPKAEEVIMTAMLGGVV
jgi:ribose transport system ATP-binding protein